MKRNPRLVNFGFRSRRFSVSLIVLVYAAIVLLTAILAFIPRETNLWAYSLLVVLTCPTSAAAIVFIFTLGGILFGATKNLGASDSLLSPG
jgi:hypothetical protein